MNLSNFSSYVHEHSSHSSGAAWYHAGMRAHVLPLALIVMLTSCGHASDNIAFNPPAGWVASPSLFGRFQQWVKPAKDTAHLQALILARGNADRSGFFGGVLTRPQDAVPNTTLIRQRMITLCNGQHAQLLIAHRDVGSGVHLSVEMVVTTIRDPQYALTYERPIDAPADPAAETALHSLCYTSRMVRTERKVLWLRGNDWGNFGLALVALITAVIQSVAWYTIR